MIKVILDNNEVIELNTKFEPGLIAGAIIYECDEHADYHIRDDHGYDEAVAIVREAATCNEAPAWVAPNKTFLITAEHFNVPGRVQKAFATRDSANTEAADLINMMMKDAEWEPTATADTWDLQLDRLQDRFGAQFCYVELSELEVQP